MPKRNLPDGIRQRGNSYLIDVTIKGTRRTKTIPALDLDRAIAEQAQLRADMLRQVSVPAKEERDTWTLRQAYDKCVELYWSDANSGVKLARNAEIALEHFGEATPLDVITDEKLDQYAAYLMASGNSNATINRKLSAVSRMLTLAVKRGKLVRKPSVERRKEFKGRIRFLSHMEEQQVLGTLASWGKDEHAEAVCVLIDTGMRPSELYALVERDLDFMNGIIHVWKTKNKEARSIPMTQRVKEILWRRSQVIMSGALFPYDNFWMEHVWDRVKGHIGLGEDKEFIPYALRHTCISRLVQRGVPLKVVMEWAGHKNIQTTMRYAHLCPTNLMDAVKVLEIA